MDQLLAVADAVTLTAADVMAGQPTPPNVPPPEISA